MKGIPYLALIAATACAPTIIKQATTASHPKTRLEPAPPSPLPTPAPSRASRSHTRHLNPVPDFDALAECESSGNPHAVSPSGRYEGLFQFDLATWRSVGGTGHPKDATPAEQRKRAWLLYLQRGRKPWPVCGARL